MRGEAYTGFGESARSERGDGAGDIPSGREVSGDALVIIMGSTLCCRRDERLSCDGDGDGDTLMLGGFRSASAGDGRSFGGVGGGESSSPDESRSGMGGNGGEGLEDVCGGECGGGVGGVDDVVEARGRLGEGRGEECSMPKSPASSSMPTRAMSKLARSTGESSDTSWRTVDTSASSTSSSGTSSWAVAALEDSAEFEGEEDLGLGAVGDG